MGNRRVEVLLFGCVCVCVFCVFLVCVFRVCVVRVCVWGANMTHRKHYKINKVLFIHQPMQ